MNIFKKELIPLSKTPPIYVVVAFITGFFVWDCISFFNPTIPFWFFWIIYILCSAIFPVAFLMKDCKIRKYLDYFGNYFICVQYIFASAVLLDIICRIIFVGFLNIPINSYMNFAKILYIVSLFVSVYAIIHATIVYYKKYNLTSNKLENALHIVHLSDLHLGSINNVNKISKLINRINKLNADLIVVTGDTFTENLKNVPDLDGIQNAFCKLKSKYGTFACLGNHDAGADFDDMINFFDNSNIKLLCDEVVTFDNITLVGRLDLTPLAKQDFKRKSIDDLLKNANFDNLIISLDHQPTDMENSANALVDLMLSGHTHGGQFFPINLAIRWFFPHYYGYKKYKNMHLVISSGTLTAIPSIRLGSKSELISIFIK